MLDYNSFKEIVESNFLAYFPPEYRNMELSISPVAKNNTYLDGLTLKSPNSSSELSVSPVIYVNYIYDNYRTCCSIDTAIRNAAASMIHAYRDKDNILDMIKFDQARSNIVFELVNTSKNSHSLNNIPHRDFHDLSIIYRWIVSIDSSEGISSTIVTNALSEKLGLTENDLYSLAMENTQRIFPVEIIPIAAMLERLSGEPLPVELYEDDPVSSMHVITNYMNFKGAVAVLYDEPLDTLSQKLGSDLYVMPSSIHEFIAIPVSMGEPRELSELVTAINATQVVPEERLSDNVYHYDMKEKTLSLATHTPDRNQSIADKLASKKQQLNNSINNNDISHNNSLDI